MSTAPLLNITVPAQLERQYQELARVNPMVPGDVFDTDKWARLWADCVQLQETAIVRPDSTSSRAPTVLVTNAESMRALDLCFHVMARVHWHWLQLVAAQARREPVDIALISNVLEHLADFAMQLAGYAVFYGHLVQQSGTPPNVWLTWREHIEPELTALGIEFGRHARSYVTFVERNMALRMETMRMPGAPPVPTLPREEEEDIDILEQLRHEPTAGWSEEERRAREVLLQVGDALSWTQ